MNPKLTRILPSLAVGGLLLALGALATTSGARTAEAEAALADALEAEARGIATDETGQADRQYKRRARASLAMPYFSFGQSLRPRG